jgi:hypothetical protein
MPGMDSTAYTKEQPYHLKVLSSLKDMECKVTLCSGFDSSKNRSNKDVLHLGFSFPTTPIQKSPLSTFESEQS